MMLFSTSDPATALSNAASYFVTTLWPNCINMITGNYYLMIMLFGGLIASAFRFIRIAKDSVE